MKWSNLAFSLIFASPSQCLMTGRQAGASHMWGKVRNTVAVAQRHTKSHEVEPLSTIYVTSNMVGEESQIGLRVLPPHSSRKAPAAKDGSPKYTGILEDIQQSYEAGGKDRLVAAMNAAKALKRGAVGVHKMKTNAKEVDEKEKEDEEDVSKKDHSYCENAFLSLRDSVKAVSTYLKDKRTLCGCKKGKRAVKEDEIEFIMGEDDKSISENIDPEWERTMSMPIPRALTPEEEEVEEMQEYLWTEGMDASRELVQADSKSNMEIIEKVSQAADVISLWALKHGDKYRFANMPLDIKQIIAWIFAHCLSHQIELWLVNDEIELPEELKGEFSSSLEEWSMSFIKVVTSNLLDIDDAVAAPIVESIEDLWQREEAPRVVANPSFEDYQKVVRYFEEQARGFKKDESWDSLPDIVGCPGRAVFVREIVFRLMSATIDTINDIYEEQDADDFMSVSDGMVYSSRGREIVFHFANLMGVSPIFVVFWEKGLGIELSEAINVFNLQKNVNKESASARRTTAAIMLGVGVVICIASMGLAIPAISGAIIASGAAAVHTFGATGLFLGSALKAIGVALGSKIGAVALVSVFGVVGAGLGAWKLSHTHGNLKGFDLTLFRSAHDGNVASYQVLMAASGILSEATPDAFQKDWIEPLDYTFGCTDTYAVEWEVLELLALNTHVANLVATNAVVAVGKEIGKSMLKKFFSGSLYLLFLPLSGLQTVLNYDTTWKVLHAKAKLAGIAMSKALMKSENVGIRPVQLVGYGMGAMAIFHCLVNLYNNKAFHVVSDVFLLGLPVGITNLYQDTIEMLSDKNIWNMAAAVVAGRFVNGYCSTDWMLLMLQWYQKSTPVVAGAFPTTGIPKVENIDLSPVIADTRDYPKFMMEVLTIVGFSHAASFMETESDMNGFFKIYDGSDTLSI